MVEKFDCIVGAGMSGNAAAYTLASKSLKVLQLERGEYSGSKNVQGAIMYADKERATVAAFRKKRGITGIFGDAFKLARARR